MIIPEIEDRKFNIGRIFLEEKMQFSEILERIRDLPESRFELDNIKWSITVDNVTVRCYEKNIEVMQQVAFAEDIVADIRQYGQFIWIEANSTSMLLPQLRRKFKNGFSGEIVVTSTIIVKGRFRIKYCVSPSGVTKYVGTVYACYSHEISQVKGFALTHVMKLAAERIQQDSIALGRTASRLLDRYLPAVLTDIVLSYL